MKIDVNEYIHRVNGIPLYYNGVAFVDYHRPPIPTLYDAFHTQTTPDASPPYASYEFLMSKIAPHHSPLTLTPPISPLPEPPARRGSVIMKVENCQVIHATTLRSSESQVVKIENVCRWENCYR